MSTYIQSLKVAGVDLRNDYFSHCKLYISCSRTTSSDSFIILLPEGSIKNILKKYYIQGGIIKK